MTGKYFYFYTAVTSIGLLVHLIVNWHQLADWRNLGARRGALEYRVFLICLMLSFVSDVLWGVFAEIRAPHLLYADNVFYFTMMALSLYSWTNFVVTYLEMRGLMRTILLWTGLGVIAFLVVTLVVNNFDYCLFWVDAAGEYHTGPLRNTVHILLLSFNALGSALTLHRLLRARGRSRRHYAMVFTFGVTMMTAIALQFANVLLPYYSIGCLLGCCLLHVFLVEEVREDEHRSKLLAGEYEAQLAAEREAAQAKSMFFSTVSHDIRTPLNAIIGFSDLLDRGVADEEERKRYVASILSSGKVLARLVDDMLDLSKMERGKLEILNEPTDVPKLVREVVAACEVVRAGKRLKLRTEIGEMPLLDIDPQRLRQIAFNLLSNAYKYTDEGAVTVRAGWRDSGTLTLSVEDTGRGISEENISRILQPFVQVVDRNHRDGTGLGLPICHRLASLMGGELSIASKVGVGSTFTITLHGVRTAEAAHAGGEADECPSRPQAKIPSRVLVVDDSPVNRMVLKALLGKCGVADVPMAINGQEALEMLRADPKIDCVLSDLWMPVMDGYGLVREIRADAQLSHLPVYLVTADVEARNRFVAAGFTGILLKPITLERIMQGIALS